MKPVFYALSAAAFVIGVNLRLFDALLPGVAEEFGVAATTASVAVTAFTFAYGLFQVVHGPLGDRLGKLRVISVATLAVSVTSLGCAFVPSLAALAWLRFATGVAAAAVFPLSMAWIGDNTGYRDRQAVIGRFVGFLLFGQILGPALGGLLAQTVSWREVFYILAAVSFVVGVLLARQALGHPPAPVPTGGRDVLRTYAGMLRDRWVLTIMATSFVEGALFFGVLAYAGAYLKASFGLPYLAVGALLACYGVGGIVYSLLVRRLMARLDERGFVLLASAILLVGFAALPLLPLWQAAAPTFAAIGFGFYLLHNTLQTQSSEMAPQARGMAVSLFAFSLFLGQASGVAVYGRLISAVGYRWAFAAAGLLLASLCLWFSGRLSARKRTA